MEFYQVKQLALREYVRVRSSMSMIIYKKHFFLFRYVKIIQLIRKMSGECCVNPGAKQSHEAQGSIQEIGGINTYKTGQGKSGIIVFTDVFGYRFPNIQKIADTIAQNSQTTVFIPDCFNEDAMDPKTPNLMALLPDWLKKHPPTDVFAVGEKLLSSIKEDNQSIGVDFLNIS